MKATRILFVVWLLAMHMATAARADSADDLHAAVRHDDRPKVEALLKAQPTLLHAKTELGWTPLHTAAYFGSPEIALLLIRKNANVNAAANGGETPLHIAARNSGKSGDFMVELLKVAGANIKARDNGGNLPLHVAVYRGSKAKVEVLFWAGLEEPNKAGETPLRIAVLGNSRNPDFVEFLLKKGAKPDINSATFLGQTQTVKELLLKNPKLAKARFSRGISLLHLAARLDHKDIAELLILNGADVNANSGYCYAPNSLRLAKTKELKQLLLRHGASGDFFVTPQNTAR